MHRLRIIAGPNGSGKTTLTKDLISVHKLNFGIYINADDIEKVLRKNLKISFRRFKLKINEADFRNFYSQHALKDKSLVGFSIRYNTLYLSETLTRVNYFPTLFADFIRYAILYTGNTLSFETVMSGSDKIEFLRKAKEQGYRIYLYFICIEKDASNLPTPNINRVKDRVSKHGHDVPESLIAARYEKTLKNLLPALALSNRAYIFDNSGKGYEFVAEITDGTDFKFSSGFVPAWFEEYVLKPTDN